MPNIASVPTTATADVGALIEKEAARPAGTRAFECPGCGKHHLVTPKPDAGQTLHFEFTCSECDYSAAVGLS